MDLLLASGQHLYWVKTKVSRQIRERWEQPRPADRETQSSGFASLAWHILMARIWVMLNLFDFYGPDICVRQDFMKIFYAYTPLLAAGLSFLSKQFRTL
jgi:hypothetical protein